MTANKHRNILIAFAIVAQNVKDDITFLLKILCALANIHHSMCNEIIVFEQWCYLWNLFMAVWQQ